MQAKFSMQDVMDSGGSMRCPRCAYKGKLFNGRCAVCGYPLEQEAQEGSEGNTAAHQPFSQTTGQFTPISNYFPSVFAPDSPDTSQGEMTLNTGDTLRNGRYRLQERIALPASQQNQGMAWNAYDHLMANRFVVVREVKFTGDLAATSTQKDFLANKIAQRLSKFGEHPGLPTVIDLFRENGNYFLVFLYPQGETLTSLLKRWRNGLPEYMIVEYAWQLCDILSLLADQPQPLVHGAITPDTILVSEDSKQVILMHLPLLPPRESTSKIDDSISGYLAPEQVHGSITPASDLYSLAATLYHAATGSSPQERPPSFYPPARRFNDQISPTMELLLARQLRLTVAQRYSSPRAMQEDIETLIETYATQSTRAVVPFQSSEIPVLSLKDEEPKRLLDFRNLKTLVIPMLLGIMLVLGLLLVVIFHT